MDTEIFLIRHAFSMESILQERTIELDRKGQEDAEEVGMILEQKKISAVISSPYPRAIQTVGRLAVQNGVDLTMDGRFRERKLAEDAYEIEDIAASLRYCFDRPTFAYPGGESNNDALRRGVEGVYDVAKTFAGKLIVIGLHGNILSIILNYFDEQHEDLPGNSHTAAVYKLIFRNGQFAAIERVWIKQPV
ncbi:histidine phosphatase family protein [Bacillus sp. 1P06AnD]|uniref:histidine phosphatase family protein n=1 Tax=Bacillus sp. 1P06AnD TaxID=3132208 RepID=UPI0039A01A28